ncbi:hypothetical protein [Telmatospirillum sp.]|uniref:hypothetical protein n=1 Tax=Telmatospirillum sp. TaxID=2079197 RepID=UPI00284EE509|nr:hypothetical protein [Telmatospirillum sp.]MDR3439674.1 hypothetical protein [Telmatospirillum sp.]
MIIAANSASAASPAVVPNGAPAVGQAVAAPTAPQTISAAANSGGRPAPQDVVSLSNAARQIVQGGGDRDGDGDSH